MSNAIDQLVEGETLFFLNKLSPKQVQEWLEREEGYNAFDAEVAKRIVETCLHFFPLGRFYVGREYSRVVYFDTGTKNYWRDAGSDTMKMLLLELDTQANSIDELDVKSGVAFSYDTASGTTVKWLHKLYNVPSPIVRMWWD